MNNFIKGIKNFVLVIFGDKGGIGKTTNALNLLCRIIKDEPSAILIDCDNDQYSSAKIVALRKKNGIIPELNVINMSSRDLEKNILEISKKHKVIIVEFGKAIGDMEEKERTRAVKLAVKIADKIVMPIQPTKLDTDTIEKIEEKLLIAKASSIPALILPSRVMSKKQLGCLLASEPYLKYFKISKSAIWNRLCYQEVHDDGRTIFDVTNSKIKSVKSAINESEQSFQEIFYE